MADKTMAVGGQESAGCPAVLQDALRRMLAGGASQEDLVALRGFFGGRKVQIQGSADGATIVTGDGNIVLPSADAATVKALLDRLHPPNLHQLRPPTKTFVGREEELKTLLAGTEKGGATIFGLRGMAGIGKTELAMIAADRLKERFPDAQILLEMQGTNPTSLSPEGALSRVIQAFHPEACLPESLADLQTLYLSVLNDKRVLILADNAANADQIRPLIPPRRSCLLVTSRVRFELKDWVTVNVSVLPDEEARKLLCSLAPRLNEKEAAELAKACGYLPLALCLAGGALRVRPELDAPAYVDKLKQTGERLSQLDRYRHLTAEQRGIESSLSLSYELLPSDRQAFWRALSVFPASFNANAGAAVSATDAESAAEWLGDLWTYSLVEGQAAAQGRYRLHDLAREFAAARSSCEERAVTARRHAKYFIEVLRQTSRLYEAGGENVADGLSLFDLERANIDAGQAWSAAHLEDDDEAARLCTHFPGVGAFCLDLRQHPRRERIPWLATAITAARKLKDRWAEGTHLGNLGLAYADLGEISKAIELYEQRLKIARDIGDRRGEGSVLGNLGNAYNALGKISKAIECYEQDLIIAREIGDRRGESSVMGSLGQAHATLGEVRKATQFYKKALDVAREIGDLRSEGNALGNLGLAYATFGEIPEAISVYEQRLAIARKIGDQRGEGSVLFNMAMAYWKLKDLPRAIFLARAALAIFEQTEDPNAEKVKKWLGEQG